MIQQSNSQTLIFMGFLLAILVPTASAQNTPSGARNKELRRIDVKATKMDEVFLRNAFEIASEYENAGDVARAVNYLHAMSLVKPGLPQIEGKLKQLRKQVLAANGFGFEHELSTTWGKPVAFVKAGKPFRIDVQGQYDLSIDALVGAEGFSEKDIQSEMINDAPLGKLMGIIIENPNEPISKKGEKGKGRGKEEKPKPFEIGAGKDIKTKQTGYLFLKVNVPQESEPRGSLQIQLSGYVLAPDGQNIGN